MNRFVWAGLLALLFHASAIACSKRDYASLDDGSEHENAQAFALRLQGEYIPAENALLALSTVANAYNCGIPDPIGGPKRQMTQAELDAAVCKKLNDSLDGGSAKSVGLDNPGVAKFVGDRNKLHAKRLTALTDALYYVPSVVEYMSTYEEKLASSRSHQFAQKQAREACGGLTFSRRQDPPPSWKGLRSLSESQLPEPLDTMIAKLVDSEDVPNGFRDVLFRYQQMRKKHKIEPTQELIALVKHLNDAAPVKLSPPPAPPKAEKPVELTAAHVERFYKPNGSGTLMGFLEVKKSEGNIGLLMTLMDLPKVKAIDRPTNGVQGTIMGELMPYSDAPAIPQGLADKKPEAARDFANILRIIAKHTRPGETFTPEQLADAKVAKRILGI